MDNSNKINQSSTKYTKQSQESDGKKIAIVILMIGVLMLCTTGATYAYFALSATNDNVINGTAATVSLNLTVNRVAPTTTKYNNSTKVLIPQKNETLATAINSTNLCVDGKNNIVCSVYQITIKNNSTARVVLNGDLTFSGITNMGNLYWKLLTNGTTINTASYGNTFYYKVSSSAVASKASSGEANTKLEVNLTLDPANSGSTCSTTVPTSTTSTNTPNSCVATYFIVVWLNETGASQTDNGTFVGTVSFLTSNGLGGVTSTFT